MEEKFELWLLIYNNENKTSFKKHFKSEYSMDKFINKLRYSKKLYVLKDSRDELYDWIR